MRIEATRMYRVHEVSALAGVSPSTVYRAIEAGELPAMRVGRTRVHGSELAAWLTAGGARVDVVEEVA